VQVTDSLAATEAASAAIAVAPRVKLSDIEAAIGGVYYTTAARALSDEALSVEHLKPLGLLTICIVIMRNGFTVIGKSAPASPENFNADLGRQFSYEDAVRQLWPLMGFSLRDRLGAATANKSTTTKD
jgi:hypothetical protein